MMENSVQSPVRFVDTDDGVQVAYCQHGDGLPLVFVRGWISHLELMWAIPAFRAYIETLAQQFQVVRYDCRGNGLSDHEPGDFTLDGLVADLHAVVDGLGLETFVLYGTTFGALIAIAYAASHPDRVSKLIVDGSYARGSEIAPPQQRDAFLSMVRTMPDHAAYVLSLLTAPGDESLHERTRRGRRSISNRALEALYTLAYNVDISDLLPSVSSPTLVLHRRGSHSIPFDLGRRLAARIPGARFVPLEGREQNPWEGNAQEVLTHIGQFLGVEFRLPERHAAPSPLPLTILFTDMESSTAITQRIGDSAAQRLLQQHNSIIRRALESRGGREIKHTGDGLMASFVSASSAVECAIAIQDAFEQHNADTEGEQIRVRIALNAGEPIAEGQDLFGTAVQLAARILEKTEPGQILVANVVRELVAGRGFRFRSRGQLVPRGFDEPVGVYEVDRSPA